VGMGTGKAWYWETVYRTNIQTSYNVGRALGFEATKPLALEFVGLEDGRQTDICRKLSEARIIRPYGDPFWDTHTPPLHFNCRSTLRAIYDKDELPEEYAPIKNEKAYTPAKGFGSAPTKGDGWWEELAGMKAQTQRYGVQEEIEAAREKLIGRNMSNGNRRSVFEKLTKEEERYVKHAAKEIEIPTKMLEFIPGRSTGYSDSRKNITIGADVFPSNDGSIHNRDTITVKAVLAHEYYGHYHFRKTKLGIGDPRDEIRASYYAAVHTPGLTKEERQQLMRDALDRANDAGIKLNMTDEVRRILYGYQND